MPQHPPFNYGQVGVAEPLVWEYSTLIQHYDKKWKLFNGVVSSCNNVHLREQLRTKLGSASSPSHQLFETGIIL